MDRKWLLRAAIVSLLLGIGLLVFGQLQEGGLDGQLSRLENRIGTTYTSFLTASGEIEQRSTLYQNSYSTDMFSQRNLLSGDCGENHGITVTIQQARSAQKDRGIGDPFALANDAERRLDACDQFAASVVPYYDSLQNKTNGANQRITDAVSAISSARSHIDQLAQDQWNVSYGVVFRSQKNQLAKADGLVALARSESDKIAAYNDADSALQLAQSAQSSADSDHQASRDAITALSVAQQSIQDATAFIGGSTYNQTGATQSLSVAQGTYNSAVTKFYGNPALEQYPDYTGARDTANLAASQATSAKTSAMTPTPVPPTPVPQSSTTIIIVGGSNSGTTTDYFGGDEDNSIGSSYPSSPDYTESDSGSSSLFEDNSYDYFDSGSDSFGSDSSDFGSCCSDSFSTDDGF